MQRSRQTSRGAIPAPRKQTGDVDQFCASRRRLAQVIVSWAGLAMLGLIGCEREDNKRIWIGAAFPEFKLPTPDGTLHHSHEYFGRPLLINFWATWCPPCRNEMADLDALRRKLGPRGLQLLAISVDADRNLVREYLRKENLGLAVLVDNDQRWSASALGIPGFPTTYLIGSDGLILDAWIGPRAWDDPTTQAEIAATVGLA